MTETHPAVAHVLAALDRAEQQARVATEGPWHANAYDDDWDGTGHVASIGTQPAGGRWSDSAKDVVGHGYEGGGVCEWSDAVHIAAWSPDVVLRLVAADRALLAEHAPDGRFCRTCAEWREDLPVSSQHEPDDAVNWPCPTVLNRARAWGWEDAA